MQYLIGCFKLQEIKLGKNVTYINPGFLGIFNYTGKVTIDAENRYYMVENNILYSKDKTKLLKVFSFLEGSVSIDPKVQEIGDGAFSIQSKMTTVCLPIGLKKIGKSAFHGCKFSIIEIPSTTEEIGEGCFQGNENLDVIIVNKEANSITGAPWGAPKGMKVVNWKK